MNQSTTPTVAAGLLEQQIKSITEYDRELTPGATVKTLMEGVKSRDLWQVKPQDLVVIEGFNPRVQDAAYFEGIETLASDMVRQGYMQDKPIAGYSSKVDGKDVIVVTDGHRRRAAVMRAIELGAPIKTIPMVLKERSDDMVKLTLSLLHANESTPFNMYEKAIIAKRMKGYGWANKDIAVEMHCTPAFVGELLTLAGAPQAIQQLVKAGQMSGTLAVQTVKKHGEQAAEVAKAGANKVAAKGGKKVTAKDTVEADPKMRKARKYGYELYLLCDRLYRMKKVTEAMPNTLITEMDVLLTAIEKVKVPKEPKPPKAPKAIKVKAIKVKAEKKTPLAKKVAGASKKTASKKLAPWDQQAAKDAANKPSKANGADGEQRAAAAGRRGATVRRQEH